MAHPHHIASPERRHQTVRESMRPAVTTVESHAHLAAAMYLMRRAHETALVVTTNDGSRRPIAIITDTDVAQAVADGKDLNETHIDEVGSLQPITVQPETAISEAIALMVSAGIRHLPVVEHGFLVGILDITDADWAVSAVD